MAQLHGGHETGCGGLFALRIPQSAAVILQNWASGVDTHLAFGNSLFDLLNLDLAHAFDLAECLACGSMDRLCDLQSEALAGRSTWTCGMTAYGDRVEAISFKLRDVCSTDPSMKMLAADAELIVRGYDHHEPECCRCRE
jgi:hypothetical protein